MNTVILECYRLESLRCAADVLDIHHAERHITLLAYDINLKRQNRSRLDQPAEFWLDFRLNKSLCPLYASLCYEIDL